MQPALHHVKTLNINYRKKIYGKLEKLPEPGQELQIDFTGKLHNKHIHGEIQILIAVDRFSKWQTVKICKTVGTEEVTSFLLSNFDLYGILEKIKSDKRKRLFPKSIGTFAKSEISKLKIAPPPRLHTGNGAVESAIQTYIK